jgi:HTH-type transcriptional regulator/antitoxin HipB
VDDLDKYIEKRKKADPEFAADFDEGFEEFKIGVMLKEARKKAGLTQDAMAALLKTKKTAISRIENHAEDIRLSTMYRYSKALGMKMKITFEN